MKVVYFDNNATTQVAPEVREAMLPFFDQYWANPSSMHSFGGQVQKHIERAREQVAALIHAHPEEIVFTSCGTESDNHALRGALEAMGGQRRLITSAVEHPAVRSTARALRSQGHALTELPVNEGGHLDLDQLAAELDDTRGLVSLMWANNETGVIFPIEKIAPLVKEKGWLFHSDAVQTPGKLALDMAQVPVDLLAISGHKLHAPKGIGVLYVRRGTPLAPLIIGGHQEAGRRAGTENVPYIVGLGRACELAAERLAEEQTRVAALRDRLEAGLLKSCPDVLVNGDPACRLPNTTNLSFSFIEGEAILLRLNEFGICASSGSACTSGSLEPSHVIRALGVPFISVHGSIRFSLSTYNTEAEVDFALEKVPPVIQVLREMSPFHEGSMSVVA